MRRNLMYTVALLLAGAVMAACSGSDDMTDNTTPTTKPSVGGTSVVELSGTLGSKGELTRSVAADGTGTWEVGDKFAIYYETANGHSTAVATVNSVNDNGSANFNAMLSSPKAGSNSVNLVYPASAHDGQGGFKTDDLMNQGGTLDYINANGLDIETATTTLNVDGAKATLNNDVTMQPQVCLYKLDLKDQNYTELFTKKLEISDGTNSYTITPTAATGSLTIAMLPASNATFTFTATTTKDTQTYTKLDGVTLANCTLANIGDVFDKDGNIYEASMVPGAIYRREFSSRYISAGRFYSQALTLYKYEANTPGIAVIAYVGNHGSVDDSSTDPQTGFRGLAVAMQNANGGNNWCTQTNNPSTLCSDASEYSEDLSVALQWKNGISRTTYLLSNPDGHDHLAAKAAHWNVQHPAGTSDWFLPSLGQWQLIFQGLATKRGNMTELCTDPMKDSLYGNTSTYSLSNDNVGPVLENAGAAAFVNCTWSSSEYSSGQAWALAYDLSATHLAKVSNYSHQVRPVIAF